MGYYSPGLGGRMKKWLFALLLFVFVVSVGESVTYADIWRADDNGGPSVYYVTFRASVTPGDTYSKYKLTVALPMDKPDSIRIDTLYAVYSDGSRSMWCTGNDFIKDENIYYKEFTVLSTAQISYFELEFEHVFDNYTTIYKVKSTISVEEPEPDDPTPIITPVITPDITPEITPEAEPDVWINVNVNGLDAEITYYTGGKDSVESVFDIQWYLYGKNHPDELSETVATEKFVDGQGTYKLKMEIDEWYQATITYTYLDANGNKKIKEISTDYFQAVNDNPIVIWNLRSLVKWCWDELMEIPITYEGYTITFKQIFLFALIGPTLILFFMYLMGMRAVGFMFFSRKEKNTTTDIEPVEQYYDVKKG